MPSGDNHRKLTDAQRAEIVKRYTTPRNDGTWDGCPTLAREFGVTAVAVLYHLRRAGVPIRDGRTAHSGGKRCKPVTRIPQGEAPLCCCGCQQPTTWSQRNNAWHRYCAGHYTQRGVQNPTRQQGTSAGLYGPGWARLAAQYRKNTGYQCEQCGRRERPSANRLHVHHRDRNPRNQARANLIVLCVDCHAGLHATLR